MTEMKNDLNCSQCGQSTKEFHEGCCNECYQENQARLEMYDRGQAFWDTLNSTEKWNLIKNVI